MDIKTFSNLMSKNRLVVFTSRDLEILAEGGSRRSQTVQLHQWAKKGWILKLKRGLYELTYPKPEVIPDFYIANRLYAPSYVSLDTALSHYQILPEFAAQVTSVTSKPTRRFSNPHGLFTFFTITSKAFIGYGTQKVGGFEVFIADPEKAVMDRLYMALRRGENVQLLSSRWDRVRLRKHRRKLMNYASAFMGYQEKLMRCLRALL